MRQTIVSLLIHLYTWLLRLYPSTFREQFGEEMAGVFREQMEEAAARGGIHLLRSCWREVRDWPIHCLQTHWQVRQQRLALPMAAPPSWWDTAMAGLPYLLFALIVSGSTLIFLVGQATGLLVSLLFGFGFVFLLLLVLTAAWWRRWPVWSAAWLGFLFFVLLVLFLPGYAVDWLGQGWQMQPVRYLVSEAGFPLLWLAVLYVLLARWPRFGLVAALPPLGITWLLYLELVPESVSLTVTAVAWVWLGLVAIVLLRWRYHNWDVWLLYLAGAVVGIVFVFTAHYLTEVPLRDRTFASMGEDVLSELIPALVPLVGILLLLTLRRWSQVNGRAAVHSYRLLLAGIVLTFVGLQIRLLMARQLDFLWPENYRLWSTAVLLLGCSLMILGIWLLVRNRKQWLPPVSWLLIGLLSLLPLVANSRWLTVVYGPGSVWLISRLTGIVWLAVAAWLVGAIGQQLPPIPAQKQSSAATANQPERSTITSGGTRLTIGQLITLVLGLAFLVVLLLPATTLAILFPNNQSQPFDLATSMPLFLLMTTGLIMAAGLLSSGFKVLHARTPRAAVSFFVLGALLLAAALRNYYWLMIWDSTYDGLGVLWLFIPGLGIILATLVLVATLPKRAKWAAFLYLLLLPPTLLVVTQRTQHVDFRQLTEMRAERVSQALDAYYDQEGQYPADLGQLTPRYLRSLSEPMIIFDQDWCYDGGGDTYRFGYVYREHWSNPNLVGSVYSGTGATNEGADRSRFCQEEITALQLRDPTYYSLRNE